MKNTTTWPRNMARREFLRRYGIASSAITLSPFFVERFASVGRAAANLTRVYKLLLSGLLVLTWSLPAYGYTIIQLPVTTAT